MSATIQFKPGDDMQWAGVLKLTGVTDFTGYTAKASVKLRDDTHGGPSGESLADVGPAALSAQGAFVLTIPKETTVEWPENVTLVIDVVITTAAGLVMTSATGEFETAERVTEPV